MIAYLQGQLLEVTDEICVLLTGGVGYELHCSLGTLADLQMRLQQKETQAQLFVHTHVREDALQLFGFATPAEKTLFLSLLKVNGIGPKSAMSVLSGASVNQLTQMIESEDVKALSKLPKVGKKTAEQMILTLKGKLVMVPSAGKNQAPVLAPVQTQIRSALVNLGFRAPDVEKVVTGLGELSFEEGVRQGLAALTGASA